MVSRVWPRRLTSMIATMLSRPSQPACWKASHIEPSAISESPHRHQTRYGSLSRLRAAIAMPTEIGRPWPSEPGATSGGGGPGGRVGRRDARGGMPLEPRVELAEGEELLVADRAGRLEDRVVQRRGV